MAGRSSGSSEWRSRGLNGDLMRSEVGASSKCTANHPSDGAAVDVWNPEQTVNRWILEFNFHCALQAFRDDKTKEFCAILDVIAESDPLPLESILTILGQMRTEFSLDEDLFQEVRGAVVEQAVVESVKNNCFREASKILDQQLDKDTGNQKLLSAIIKEKNSSHPDLDLFSYSILKKRMLCFAENLIGNSEPFLLLSAKKSISNFGGIPNEEVRMVCNEAADQNVQASDGNKCLPSSKDECCVCSSRLDAHPDLPYSLAALQTAFCVLHKSAADPVTLFKKMDILDFKLRENSETQCSMRSKKQNLKAKTIQQCENPSANCIQAVSRFIIDPDSQDEVECPDVISDGRKNNHNGRKSPSTSCNDNGPLKEMANQETSLKVKRRKLFNHPGIVEKKEDWSDEEFLFDIPQNMPFQNGRTSPTESYVSNSSKRQKWTVEESEWIKQGVQRFGAGNWQKILKAYPFCDRTSVMIKDRWRTMQKLGLI
ncbi:telomeric repeat binding factor a isoform X2 [Narcine bancroftii]|uniref:telomeric repeat binding factor a isoform X2 n=1 Tax=Narcine bancroftii TaxID=1343680 RepID=UPI003831DA32